MDDGQRIDAAKRAALIADLAAASGDVVMVGERHGLPPERLAAWFGESGNSDWLDRLTDAADRHSQWFISRYRIHIAGALIKTINDENTKPAELVRAAALLLKLELRKDRGEGDPFASRALTEADYRHVRVKFYPDELEGEVVDDAGA